MNERVRRQEEARGWHRLRHHRLSEAQVEVIKKLMEKAEAREWEHDRRLRGQYE